MRLAILSVVLFLSGISALIFETLWLRLSGLAFGNSIWAAALILSSFMAGLALGTAIAASAKFRIRPLKLYAALEIAVALFGCTIVFALPVIGELLRPIFQTLWNHQTILLALRVLFSFVILLIPTTAMGLTLPVVLEDRFLERADFGRTLGLLYGFNTLGAVPGALVGAARVRKSPARHAVHRLDPECRALLAGPSAPDAGRQWRRLGGLDRFRMDRAPPQHQGSRSPVQNGD